MGMIAERWQELGVLAPGAVGVVAIFAACYLGLAHRRYGRLTAWPGKMTHAVPVVVALGVVALVWPAAGCVGVPASPGDAPGIVPILVLGGLAAVVGFLCWHRYRRGVLATVSLGALLGLGGAVARAELAPLCAGVLPEAAFGSPANGGLFVAGALGGVLGVLVGWLVARFTDNVLPRGWPGAIPDWGTPTFARRLLAIVVDFALWWSTASLLAGSVRALGTDPGVRGEFAFLGVALLLGLLVPFLSASRATLGRAAMSLALRRAGAAAPRWRVAVRSLLYYGPVVALFGLGFPLWSLVVLALHVAPALVHPERAGLFDLLSGVRVTTRFTVDGRPPTRMVRLIPRATEENVAAGTAS